MSSPVRVTILAAAVLMGAAPARAEGGLGLAAKYPNDRGIARDPAVAMFLDYENKSWRKGWSSSNWKPYGLTTKAANVFSGRSSLEQNLKRGSTGSTIVYDFPKSRRFEKLLGVSGLPTRSPH